MGSRIELNWLLTTYFISKVLVTYSKYVHTYDAKKDSEIDCRLYADNVFFFDKIPWNQLAKFLWIFTINKPIMTNIKVFVQ